MMYFWGTIMYFLVGSWWSGAISKAGRLPPVNDDKTVDKYIMCILFWPFYVVFVSGVLFADKHPS